MFSTGEHQRITYGLEYRLFNILEESIKKNIELLLDEQPSWIRESEIYNLYNVTRQ